MVGFPQFLTAHSRALHFADGVARLARTRACLLVALTVVFIYGFPIYQSFLVAACKCGGSRSRVVRKTCREASR